MEILHTFSLYITKLFLNALGKCFSILAILLGHYLTFFQYVWYSSNK